ncbi:Major capsid protein precursor [Escherichia coli O25b:H4]|uniref:Major capsid protein n=1 Tax=Escherichia coli O25b:H4 TaxID=941280 RepID=A0A192CNC7_ECO25|nr:Major capsid protein precursor [Escherichia coli O25b:H4]
MWNTNVNRPTFDTVLTYAKLDLWAKFQDFQVRIRDGHRETSGTGPHHDRL